MTKQLYRVALDGWLEGVYRVEGDEIALTPKAAKYLLKSGQIAAPPKRKLAPAPAAPKRARRSKAVAAKD